MARYHDHQSFFGMIAGCIVCFSLFIFAIRKTTLRKRPNFFQETLRPFLTSLGMIAVGVAIAALSVPHVVVNNDERTAAIAALVFGSLLLLIMLASRRRAPQPHYIIADQIPHAESVGN
jgi:membrane associated rhomboid family serine protease